MGWNPTYNQCLSTFEEIFISAHIGIGTALTVQNLCFLLYQQGSADWTDGTVMCLAAENSVSTISSQNDSKLTEKKLVF